MGWLAAISSYVGNLFSCTFSIARVVVRVEVLDSPGAHTVNLENCFALDPGEMLHARRPITESAGRQRLSSGFVEFFPHAKVEGATDDGDMLNCGMDVGRDRVAIRH